MKYSSEYVRRSMTLREQRSAYGCMRKVGVCERYVKPGGTAGCMLRINILSQQHLMKMSGTGFFYDLGNFILVYHKKLSRKMPKRRK